MRDLSIEVRVIPHSRQRYKTVGDWEITGGSLKWMDVRVNVSRLSGEKREWGIGVHEVFEAMVCIQLGVSQADVDSWDMEYEACREEGRPLACGCNIKDEPGEDEHAPYYKAHKAALIAERAFIEAVGEDWDEYEKEVEGRQW